MSCIVPLTVRHRSAPAPPAFGLVVAAGGVFAAGAARAHGAAHPGGWGLDPLVLVPLALSAGLYALGLGRLWGRAGRGRGVSPGRPVVFAAGLVALAALLLSPVDALAERLLAAHMIQHLGVMLVVAPLMVLGRPGLVFLWAAPSSWRPALGRLDRTAAGRAWRAATHPLGAWLLYVVALWTWHVPSLYQAALTSEPIHWMQHASFLGAALVFWAAVLERPGAEGRAGAVVAIFATAVQSCALAALLTTSSTLWYPSYAAGPGGWGLGPLEDQQLAGLIMWAPSSAILIGAALAVLARLLRDAETRVRRAAP